MRFLLGIGYSDSSDIAALKLIIGHELLPDDVQNGTIGDAVATWSHQYYQVTGTHIDLFLQAVEADRRGENVDQYLSVIFQGGRNNAGQANDPDDPKCQSKPSQNPNCLWGLGNSMHDLRLSVKGYRFGEEIRTGTIGTRSQAANWLRRELGMWTFLEGGY
jgi:hypothetical protein